MDLTARAAGRRGRPDRAARAGRTARRGRSKGKQIWRYRFPAQDYDLGRGEVCDPARSRRAATTTPSTWAVGEVVGGRSRGAHGRPAARSVDEPHPRAIVPLDYVRDEGPPGGPLRPRRVGGGSRRSRRPDRLARLATCCFRLPPRVGQCAGRAVSRRAGRIRRSRRRVGSALALDHTTLADPGPARLRQDLHRRPDDLLAAGGRQAGRDHGNEPQGHRQPARRRSLEAAAIERRHVAAVQKADEDEVVDDPR